MGIEDDRDAVLVAALREAARDIGRGNDGAANRAVEAESEAALLAALSKLRNQTVPRWKFEQQCSMTKDALADRDRARVACGVAAARDVWYWQGDGTDDLKSITCPVVMSQERLGEMLEETFSLKKSLRNAHANIRDLQAQLTSDAAAFRQAKEAHAAAVGRHAAEVKELKDAIRTADECVRQRSAERDAVIETVQNADRTIEALRKDVAVLRHDRDVLANDLIMQRHRAALLDVERNEAVEALADAQRTIARMQGMVAEGAEIETPMSVLKILASIAIELFRRGTLDADRSELEMGLSAALAGAEEWIKDAEEKR